MSIACDCYQWWRKLIIEVGGPSAWCEGNHFKVGVPRPGNENFLAELSQSCIFTHLLVRIGWACAYPAPGFLHLWLLPSCEISSRSPWFAKRVVTNLSDVLRRIVCPHNQRPHAFFLTAASQCFQLARVANCPTSLSLYICVTMGRKSSVRSACSIAVRSESNFHFRGPRLF